MSQILHIFRKDCRHFLPEILSSLAITAAFIWIYPYQWTPDDLSASTRFTFLDLHHRQILANTVTILLPVGWLLLIARVVHGESLVGNRQFWVTRPYIWQKLLAEKALFLVSFICVPFTVAQACLLVRAGFPPTHYPGPLLFNLGSITIAAVLPLFALASVTANLLRIIGTFLVTTAVIVTIAFFVSSGPDTPSASLPYSDRFSIPAIVGFCGAVLLIQYSSRKLWLARSLLVALILSIAVFAVNPLEGYLFPHYYPPLAQSSKSPISFGFSTVDDVNVTESAKGQYTLSLPIMMDSAESATFRPDNIRVSMQLPGGREMASGWQAIYNQYFPPGAQQSRVNVSVDRAFLQNIQAGPVNLHVDLAITQIQAGRAAQFAFEPGADMKIPGLGICAYFPGGAYRFSNLYCRVPFHQSDLSRVEVLESPSCDRDAILAHSKVASAWTGSLSHDPSDIGFTPVWTDSIGLPNDAYRSAPDALPQTLSMCPGSSVAVTPYHLVQRFQTRTDVKGLQFSHLKPFLSSP